MLCCHGSTFTELEHICPIIIYTTRSYYRLSILSFLHTSDTFPTNGRTYSPSEAQSKQDLNLKIKARHFCTAVEQMLWVVHPWMILFDTAETPPYSIPRPICTTMDVSEHIMITFHNLVEWNLSLSQPLWGLLGRKKRKRGNLQKS